MLQERLPGRLVCLMMPVASVRYCPNNSRYQLTGQASVPDLWILRCHAVGGNMRAPNLPLPITGSLLRYTSARLPKYRATGISAEAGMTVSDDPYMAFDREASKDSPK